jgi:hypothetical protein
MLAAHFSSLTVEAAAAAAKIYATDKVGPGPQKESRTRARIERPGKSEARRPLFEMRKDVASSVDRTDERRGIIKRRAPPGDRPLGYRGCRRGRWAWPGRNCRRTSRSDLRPPNNDAAKLVKI